MLYGSSLLTLGLWFLFAVGLFLFFEVAYHSLVRARETKLIELHEGGLWTSNLALKLLLKADTYLLSLQIGQFFTSVVLGLLGIQLIRSGLVEQLHLHTFQFHLSKAILWPETLLSLIVVTILVFAFSQLGKALAFSYPERLLSALAIPITLISSFIWPFSSVVRYILVSFLHKLKVDYPSDRAWVLSSEEISQIVEASTEAGEIEEEESELIQRVIDFSDTLVREVMTPRTEIISVPITSSLDEIAQAFQEKGVSRIVVVGDSLDDVCGILLAKDLISFVGEKRSLFNIKDVMRSAYFVPEATRIDDLFDEFRKSGVHLAVVLDDHGGVEGIVTLEDLMEEIFGEIADEFDRFETVTEEIRETRSGDLLIDGALSVHDLNAVYGFHLPNGDYDTVAGFVVHQLGHIPSVGENFEYNGLSFKVEEVEQNRVSLVRLLKKRLEA